MQQPSPPVYNDPLPDTCLTILLCYLVDPNYKLNAALAFRCLHLYRHPSAWKYNRYLRLCVAGKSVPEDEPPGIFIDFERDRHPNVAYFVPIPHAVVGPIAFLSVVLPPTLHLKICGRMEIQQTPHLLNVITNDVSRLSPRRLYVEVRQESLCTIAASFANRRFVQNMERVTLDLGRYNGAKALLSLVALVLEKCPKLNSLTTKNSFCMRRTVFAPMIAAEREMNIRTVLSFEGLKEFSTNLTLGLVAEDVLQLLGRTRLTTLKLYGVHNVDLPHVFRRCPPASLTHIEKLGLAFNPHCHQLATELPEFFLNLSYLCIVCIDDSFFDPNTLCTMIASFLTKNQQRELHLRALASHSGVMTVASRLINRGTIESFVYRSDMNGASLFEKNKRYVRWSLPEQ